MEPTVFRHKRSKTRWHDLASVALYLLMGLILLSHFYSNSFESRGISWYVLMIAILLFGSAILDLLKIAGVGFLARKWKQIHLSLDEEGLTYARGGLMSPRRWSWTELSDIEYEGPGLLRRSSILFRPEAHGLVDRMTRSMDSGRRVRLRDMFDAEPEEIVAKLNEYRDRALGGANAPTN